MRKVSVITLLLIGVVASAQSTWKADKAHSRIGFDITHLMISEITGNFKEFDITATADDTFDNASFTVEIKTTSIDTDNDRRNEHLRSGDFFEVEKYPSITFKSNSYKKTGDKTFALTGNLTIHGITKAITFDGKVNGIITDKRSQKLKAGLKLSGVINRLDYQVGEETPSIGNEVTFTVNLEMAQQ